MIGIGKPVIIQGDFAGQGFGDQHGAPVINASLEVVTGTTGVVLRQLDLPPNPSASGAAASSVPLPPGTPGGPPGGGLPPAPPGGGLPPGTPGGAGPSAAVVLEDGSNQTTIEDSIVDGIRKKGNSGGNLIVGNVISKELTLTGAATSPDRALNNRFSILSDILLGNGEVATVAANIIAGPLTVFGGGSSATPIAILGNTFTFTGSGNSGTPVPPPPSPTATIPFGAFAGEAPAASPSGPFSGGAIGVTDSAGPADSTSLATYVLIQNNAISTGNGVGITVVANDPANLTVRIQGNTLRNNRIGIEAFSLSGTTDVGTIDAGSSGTVDPSLGGNNFRGFAAAEAAPGSPVQRFAIQIGGQAGGAAASARVSALNNVWSVGDPNSVVNDSIHGPATGQGVIDVGATQLSADQRYVQTLYNQFLGRTGALTGEVDGWVKALSNPGIGRAGVALGIAGSHEAHSVLVGNLYVQYLGRLANGDAQPQEKGEAAGWVSMLDHGATEEQVIAGLVASPEFYSLASRIHFDQLAAGPTTGLTQSTGDADQNFVAALYGASLNRSADNAEINLWVQQLPKLGWEGLAGAILNSSEARDAAIDQDYAMLVHRLASAEEVLGWVHSQQDLLHLAIAFAASDEFYQDGGGRPATFSRGTGTPAPPA